MSDISAAATRKRARLWVAVGVPVLLLALGGAYALRSPPVAPIGAAGGEPGRSPTWASAGGQPPALAPIVEPPPSDKGGPDFQNRLVESTSPEAPPATHVGLKASPERPVKLPKGVKPPLTARPSPEPARSANPGPSPAHPTTPSGDLFDKRH